MHYEIWTVCKGHKYCAVCRRKNKDGLALRQSMRRMIDPGKDDFDCPDGLPWLSENPTPEEVTVLTTATDNIEMEKLVKTENDITPRFSPAMLQLLVGQHFAVRSLFPVDHALVKALDEMIVGMTNPSGCTGCRLKRLTRQIAAAVDGCTDAERRKLLPLVTS